MPRIWGVGDLCVENWGGLRESSRVRDRNVGWDKYMNRLGWRSRVGSEGVYKIRKMKICLIYFTSTDFLAVVS